MDRLGGVVAGEGLGLAAVALATLLGVEAHGAVAGRRKLAVRLLKMKETMSISWKKYTSQEHKFKKIFGGVWATQKATEYYT